MFFADFRQAVLCAFELSFKSSHFGLPLCELIELFDAIEQGPFMVFNQPFGALLQVACGDVRIFARVQSGRHGYFRAQIGVLLIRMIKGPPRRYSYGVDLHISG